MLCGFGFGLEAVTTGHGNLWSALVLHIQAFGAFSHHGIGEQPVQRVFVLSSICLVSVLSVYLNRGWGGMGVVIFPSKLE